MAFGATLSFVVPASGPGGAPALCPAANEKFTLGGVILTVGLTLRVIPGAVIVGAVIFGSEIDCAFSIFVTGGTIVIGAISFIVRSTLGLIVKSATVFTGIVAPIWIYFFVLKSFIFLSDEF